MRLEKLAKDGGSGNFGCQTAYLAEDGSLVIQGDLIDADTERQLENVLPGEGAVHIKPAIVEAALARLRGR